MPNLFRKVKLMKITKTLKITWFCAVTLCLNLASTPAANIFKAEMADNLNLATSWSNSVAPGTSDVATWDNTVLVNTTTILGANLSWAGIQILNPAAGIIVNTNASGNVLTLGASGIDMSLATANLTLNNAIALGANQTWDVASGLTLNAPWVLGASVLTKNGNGTLILAGTNLTYTGGMLIAGGTVQAGSGTALGTGAVTNNNGTTLRIRTTTTLANAVNFNGTVTVDLANVIGNAALDGAWAGSGTVNFINQENGTAGIVTNRVFTIGGVGSMANFTGAVSFGTNSGILRFNDGGSSPNTGNSSAAFDLGTGNAIFLSRNRGAAVNFGELTGGQYTRITNGTSSSGTAIYSVGGRNTSTTFAGMFSDGGSSTANVAINKVGSGTLKLTGTNINTGTTTVTAGTLQIGDGGTFGQLGTNAIINNATLIYNRSDSVTNGNAISGSGSLIQQGGNTLTFTGVNSSSGTLLVNSGTVAVGATGSILCPVSLISGTFFDVSQNPAFTLNQILSGSGTVAGLLTAVGGSINPGGNGAAGTLAFQNGLTESGNVSHQFEFSTPGGTNDLISITGDLTLSGINTIVAAHFGGGTVPAGTYTLFAYTGNFNGALINLALSGASGVFTNPPNQIQVIIAPPTRSATNLTWVGDGSPNSWDTTSTGDWKNGATFFTFQSGDTTTFDNTGAANPTVNLAATVLPAAVVVNAANDYTLTGNGSISGSGGLTKTNSGKLSLLTTNAYTGPTIIGGGILEVAELNNGNAASSIGASSSDPTNLLINSSTFSYTGGDVTTDRGATLNGSAIINVTNVAGANNLTVNGSLVGPGALTKSGSGTLTLNPANSYTGGTVISNGVIALGSNAANDSGANNGLGATNSAVTFKGGTLQLFGYNGSTTPNYNTFRSPLVVPAGQTGTLRLFSRGPNNSSGLASSLTGDGTLNLVVNYVRDNLDGNWSAFTGLINVTVKPSTSSEFRINNNFGYANAAIYLNDNVIMDRASGASLPINIGELGSSGGAIVGPGTGSAVNPTWCVGWKNTSATFNGFIEDDGVTSIIKVGTGTWTLTADTSIIGNIYTGSTTVSNGVLALIGSAEIPYTTNINIASGAFLDVSGRGDGAIHLNPSQTLNGRGTVLGILDLSTGGRVSPGDLAGNVGILTVTNSVTLSGGTTLMKLNRASSPNSGRLVSSLSSVTYGGTLIVTNVGARLHAGDTFTLFSGSGLNAASFGPVTLPTYYTWDTSQLGVNGSISVSTVLPPPSISSVDFSGLAGGSITINGANGIPSGPAAVLTSTNLLTPLGSWTQVAAGNFDGSGNYTVVITVDPAAPEQFYILIGY